MKNINNINNDKTYKFQGTRVSKGLVSIPETLISTVLYSQSLSYMERLFYLLVSILSSINKNKHKIEGIALSASIWAKKLGCSKSQIFKMQNNLEQRGYLIITRCKNDNMQNYRNLLSPNLPNDVFQKLCNLQSKSNLCDEDLIYNPSQESKISFLEKTKLFIRVDYELIRNLLANTNLTYFSKILFLDIYNQCYKYHTITNKSYTCITSISEMTIKYNCNNSKIYRSLQSLNQEALITKTNFFTKSENRFASRNDKSLWEISITSLLNVDKYSNRENVIYNNKNIIYHQPIQNLQIMNSDVDNYSKNNTVNKSFASYDPSSAKFTPLIYKNYNKNNIRSNTENLDCENSFFNTVPSYEIQNPKNKNINRIPKFIESKDCLTFLPLKDSVINKISNSTNKTTEEIIEFSRYVLYKYSNLKFYSDKHFCSYMIKALHNSTGYNAEIKGTELDNTVVQKINKNSGRNFTLNAANNILSKLKSKKPLLKFHSENSFLVYMTKVFKNEKYDEHYLDIETEEKFLNKVEKNHQIGQKAIFKKRIAAVLQRNTSYEVLTKCCLENAFIKDGKFIIPVNKGEVLCIEEYEIRILLNEINSILVQKVQNIILQESKKTYVKIFPGANYENIKKEKQYLQFSQTPFEQTKYHESSFADLDEFIYDGLDNRFY